MKFEILSRWSGSVLFSLETDSLRLAVEAAVKSGVDLTDAVLTGVDLRGAVLRGAVLRDADLTGAVLTPIRDDVWAVLSASPAEAVGLRQAIVEGKINGSTYEGDCACLVGTLAKARHCKYDAIPWLRPNSRRPAERFFLAIKPGDTPENSQFSTLALEWVDQFLANIRSAFGAEVKA